MTDITAAGVGEVAGMAGAAAVPISVCPTCGDGTTLRVVELRGDGPETRELQQMGLESGRSVRLLWRNRHNLVLDVAGRTLGISSLLGSRVLVTAA